MNRSKICSNCHQSKILTDFYLCSGKRRSECKACTIKNNMRYQKKTKYWKHKYTDDESRRDYMRKYYSNNKEKFAKYRADFRERHPDYYKDYFRSRKEKK